MASQSQDSQLCPAAALLLPPGPLNRDPPAGVCLLLLLPQQWVRAEGDLTSAWAPRDQQPSWAAWFPYGNFLHLSNLHVHSIRGTKRIPETTCLKWSRFRVWVGAMRARLAWCEPQPVPWVPQPVSPETPCPTSGHACPAQWTRLQHQQGTVPV